MNIPKPIETLFYLISIVIFAHLSLWFGLIMLTVLIILLFWEEN